MGQNYQSERQEIFKEKNQKDFLVIRDNCRKLLDKAGAFKSDNVITGDCWFALNCLDRLVELGELAELTEGRNVRGQDRIYTGGGK